jgi:hypothetical protein
VNPLAAALQVVVDGLDQLSVPYVVVGSVAAATWGVLRSTRDVDIVAIIDSSSIDRFLDSLTSDELYVPMALARTVAGAGGSFNVIHASTGAKVDIFVPPQGDAFTASRLHRRQPADVLGVAAYVASAEDVLLAKLRWRLETRSDVQWRDCVEIAAANDLDLAYLYSWAEVLGVDSDLADLLDQVREGLDG